MFCRSFFRITVLAALLFCCNMISASEGTAAGDVNVRALPDQGSLKLATLAKGDKVEIIAGAGEWYKIKLPSDFPVWVSRTLVDGNKIKVSSAANLRADCNSTAPVLGKARNGDEFEIVDDSNEEWLKVKFLPASGVVLAGFVHSNYIDGGDSGSSAGPDIETMRKFFADPKGKDVTVNGMVSLLPANERPMGFTHALWENKGGKLHFMGYIYYPGGKLSDFENRNIRVVAWQYTVKSEGWPCIYEARKITER